MHLHREIYDHLLAHFTAKGMLLSDPAIEPKEVVNEIDKFVHKNWQVLGTFNLGAFKSDTYVLLFPNNLFTLVLITCGEPNMSLLTAERYDTPKVVFHWNGGNPTMAEKTSAKYVHL